MTAARRLAPRQADSPRHSGSLPELLRTSLAPLTPAPDAAEERPQRHQSPRGQGKHGLRIPASRVPGAIWSPRAQDRSKPRPATENSPNS